MGATLKPYALVTLDDARDYLKREDGEEDVRIVETINRVSAAIETYCRRKLVSRIYDSTSEVAGHEPTMLLSGRGDHEVLLREYPLTALAGVVHRYDDGTTTKTLTTTGWRIVPGHALFLPYDAFPIGRRNIEVRCTAGYLAGTHDAELDTLRLAALRWIQIAWQDRDLGIGRGTNFSVGSQSVSLIPDAIPKDVASLLRPFERAV